LGITKRISSAPAENSTPRVGESPSGGAISRIHHLLLLEGDESGYLLLDGDVQSGTDKLKLEGDATAISASITKRVGTVL
jgi:hypothetical protein